MALATQIGQAVVLDFGNGNVLTLHNVQLDDLTEADFGDETSSAAEPPEIPVSQIWAEDTDLQSAFLLEEADLWVINAWI